MGLSEYGYKYLNCGYRYLQNIMATLTMTLVTKSHDPLSMLLSIIRRVLKEEEFLHQEIHVGGCYEPLHDLGEKAVEAWFSFGFIGFGSLGF